jgi:hypothetical protein
MIPVLIEDYINKLLDKTTHFERRQFYFDSLMKIRDAIDSALLSYNKERNIRK